jgi:hypothetical protein
MNLIIDEFNSVTGFSAFGNASIITPENEISDFIAGPDNVKSVQFEFQGSGDYIEKTGLSIDVSSYDYAICHFYSSFNKYTKGIYKIAFNDTHEFEIDTFNYMIDQYFRLNEVSTITKIKITYLGSGTDRLICSHCLAVYDEIPLDIWKAVQDLIEKEFTVKRGEGFLLGNITTASGEEGIALKQINDTALEYIDRYSVIKIKDGVNEESHVLDENNERIFTLGKLLDGSTIVNNFTNANLYLTIPVRYGNKQKEYNVPSIAITGFSPTAILRGGKIETVFNTKESGTTYARQEDQIYQYFIQVACIDRFESENLTFMSKIVRDVIAREILWISGQKFDIDFNSEPEFIELTDTENPITGLVYTIKLELKEEIWINQKLPQTISQNLTIAPRN